MCYFDEYKVVKSSRARRARIDVSIRGVKVVVPAGCGLDPAQLVENKREWIEDKIEKFENQRARIPDRVFSEGALWPIFGENHVIRLNGAAKHNIQGNTIILSKEKVKRSTLKDELEKLYRKEARVYFTELTDKYARQIGVDYNKIYIRNQRTRWGSCSSKNNINYNWRLIMAPPEIIDYIVIHELLHLREANHGPQFKSLLAKYCPDYSTHQRWLKKHAVELIFTEEDL